MTDKLDRRTALLEKELAKYPLSISLDTVADILGISRRTLDNIIDKGLLPKYPVDPTVERVTYKVLKTDLMVYMLNTGADHSAEKTND